MKIDGVKNYDVYVMQLFDGHICDENFNSLRDLNQTKNVFSQIIDSLQQLNEAKKTHNDLKPQNILYRRILGGESGISYKVAVSDFGQAGKTGGTPGWTAPIFFKDRRPGREDIYSVGWLFLRLFCETKELFLSLRNNYVETIETKWMVKFRGTIEAQFLSKLIDLDCPPTVDEVRAEWNRVKNIVQTINIFRLRKLCIPDRYLTLQLQRPK